MKIIALWDRQKVAPHSRSVFVLLENQRFLYISPEQKYLGTDEQGKEKYEDTGSFRVNNAFDEDDRFTFEKANLFMLHFGGQLIWWESQLSNKVKARRFIDRAIELG